MPAIDTNTLIRFLVRDDEEQFQKVLTLFEEYHEPPLKINLPVIMEACWVLTTTYGYSKMKFIEIFRMLLETQGFEVQLDRVIQKALDEFEETNADFENCLISELNNASKDGPTYTFDKKASKLKGMKLL